MKKKIALIIIFLFLVLSAVLSYSIYNSLQNNTNTQIEKIPKFSILTINNEKINNEKLIAEPVLFIYFNSLCFYCENEAEYFKKNAYKYKKNQIFFISNENIKVIAEFAKKNNFTPEDKIIFAHDTNDELKTKFRIKTYPTLIFYSNEHILITKHTGLINFNHLSKYLHVEE